MAAGIVSENYEPELHAIECRINAEDSQRFHAFSWKIINFHVPGGHGIGDTHVYSGYTISPFGDSMIAKLITWLKQEKRQFIKCDEL